MPKDNKNIDEILSNLEKLTVVEANELAEAMAKKFNISNDIAVANVNVNNNASANNSEQKSTFSIAIKKYPADNKVKLELIKIYRRETGAGLLDALNAFKSIGEAGLVLKKDINSADIEKLKKEITDISKEIEIAVA